MEALIEAILTQLRSLSGIAFCELAPLRRDQFSLPAILLTLGEMEPGVDVGTSELTLRLHWEARLVVSESQEDNVTWSMVVEICRLLFDDNWPLINVGRAQLKGASPDHFSPETPGHRIWLVEWTQPMRVGASVWLGEGVVPEEFVVRGLTTEPETIAVE